MSAARVDALVAGAGPAGATAALCLARRGASVALVDPFAADGPPVGETLAPITREPLARLGLWERFAAAGHRPAYAVRSAWGGDEAIDQDHIFHPYGHGWHVDRRAFDRMLVEAAADAGVRLIAGTVGRAERRGDTWTIEAGGAALEARSVVDATGRPARLARRMGARRMALDRLVGVVVSVPRERTTEAHEGVTLLEAAADGWWYSARTPDDRLLLAYMTDADLWARTARGGDALASRLDGAPLTRARLRGTPGPPARVVAAVSSRLRPAATAGWLAAGDAAMAVDPLSGNGVGRALRSGMCAAGAILEEWDGDEGATRDYAAEVARAFTTYAADWRWFYGREQRFTSSEFWRRRATGHAPGEGPERDEGRLSAALASVRSG
jgi:flavin-dependent dehydrogenase